MAFFYVALGSVVTVLLALVVGAAYILLGNDHNDRFRF
jgi:hypothetical protein